MAINKDIKDKVYIDGQWIDDFYLTQEKNEELKNLRSDLTKSVEELSSGINGNTSNISILDQAINFETDRAKEAEASLKTNINEEVTARSEADQILETNISNETNNRISEDQKLQENINNVQKNINDLKVYSNNTFQTKEAASKEHTILSEQITSEITEAKNDLNETIKDSITGVNKWIDPVQTIADLPSDLDPNYTYLCKVIEEEATYQLLANQTEWKLYSSIKDYVNSNELTTAINEHNNSETSHNDIRQELETLSEVVDSLSGGTATDLTDIKDRLSTAESDIDTLQSEAHTHINKDLLDTYTQTEANLADAVAKKHEHTNKSILDNITASYTEEEKEKLTNLNSNDYEKISNKVTEINDDANDTTYPTSSAVKSYVEANQGNIDTSNLVHRTGDPQEVTASTTFTNLSLGDGNGSIISISTDDEGNINLINNENNVNLVLNSITGNNINIQKLYLSSLYYKGEQYGIFAMDSGIDNNNLLLTYGAALSLFSGQSSSSSTFNYYNTIVVNEEDLNNIQPSEGLQILVINSTYTDPDTTITIPNISCVFTYSSGQWISSIAESGFYYSDNIVESNIVINELRLYLISVNITDNSYFTTQIYPTNISTLTLTQDGTNLGTYNGQSNVSINIPKQDLSNYVTNTSLSSTLSNYVTTTNLNESLDDYLLKTGGTMTGNITLVASQSYITVGSYNILGDNGVYYFVGNEVKPLELRGNDLRPTYRVGETDSVENIALVSDLNDYVLTSDLDNYVSITSLTSTLQSYATTTQLNTKLNSNQGTTNAGKVLIVGDDGNITFTNYASVQEDGTIIFEASL